MRAGWLARRSSFAIGKGLARGLAQYEAEIDDLD